MSLRRVLAIVTCLLATRLFADLQQPPTVQPMSDVPVPVAVPMLYANEDILALHYNAVEHQWRVARMMAASYAMPPHFPLTPLERPVMVDVEVDDEVSAALPVTGPSCTR